MTWLGQHTWNLRETRMMGKTLPLGILCLWHSMTFKWKVLFALNITTLHCIGWKVCSTSAVGKVKNCGSGIKNMWLSLGLWLSLCWRVYFLVNCTKKGSVGILWIHRTKCQVNINRHMDVKYFHVLFWRWFTSEKIGWTRENMMTNKTKWLVWKADKAVR